MLKQFHLRNMVFADPVLLINEQGEPILSAPPSEELGLPQYTTSGEGWYPVYTQDEINQISASITGYGDVWVENGKIKCSGKRPDEMHRWDKSTKSWVKLTAEQQADLLAEKQAQVWELIKQKRYENSLGGVYIERVGKWFQTEEEEKTKYLGLDKVINKLGQIDWKCADNSFVKMDRTLLDEIFLQMVMTENADHINAEKHRVAMMEAGNPLEYDYSTGWTKTYKDFIKEQTNGN